MQYNVELKKAADSFSGDWLIELRFYVHHKIAYLGNVPKPISRLGMKKEQKN